eukprot:158497-Hanusia_phi.AAC.1
MTLGRCVLYVIRCRCGDAVVDIPLWRYVFVCDRMTSYTLTQTTEAVDRKRMAVRTIVKLQPTQIVDERH